MAETQSTMLPLGARLPAFSLPNAVDGRLVSPEEFADRQALLVMFICNHCPFVQHVLPELGRLARDYMPRGVGIIAINANSIETHPQDGPEHMKTLAQQEGWPFPFVFDESQKVATAFRAACTPDFYLFNERRTLVYRGQLDDSRPRTRVPLTGRDLRSAIDAVLAGRPVSEIQKPSLGCNIKWAPGRAPAYFGA